MTTTLYAEIQQRQDALIRKGLEGSAFIAPDTAAAITTLTAAGPPIELTALPAGYEDLGWFDSTGIALSEGITSSDIESWGSAEPTRSDITKRTTTAKVICQETKLLTIGVYTGADTTTVTPDPTTGEVSIEQALVPTKRYYRMLCLAVDQTEAGEIYIARFLPRVTATALDNMQMQNAQNALEYGVTFTAYPDDALGYASRYIFGGAGWQALLTEMGFDGAS